MSVLKSKRGESSMQFLETARELEVYTIRQCARFPKRFMFLITKDIVALSKAVYNNVKAANSVFPTNAAEVQVRRNYLIAANCELQCLISQLDIARDFVRGTADNKPIQSGVWQKWIDLITSEAKLISAFCGQHEHGRYTNVVHVVERAHEAMQRLSNGFEHG